MGPLTGDIADGEIVLLDSVAIIYFLDQSPAYFTAAAEIFARINAGELTGVASMLALTEILVEPFQAGDAARARAVSTELRSYPNLSIRKVDAEVAERAAELRARLGIRTADAVHVATGLLEGASWFITNDLRLRRVHSEGIQPWFFDEHR
ncbi:type II toxin-antitoxin system VapC family toxin [Longimicrobium sp.]|uniref:type II toxin-antitoxin system VapC family toxin n=1 Tax=Longimicrobium sp. TaxID=2029185 RepID=UPI002B70AEE9|nr:type II toxin-antitoxin system VapC family toxin [Longimicrobium sp.]HSU18015.1 type II toxin-antitoxin system VapC family toxin [Longimicrobium sp.]